MTIKYPSAIESEKVLLGGLLVNPKELEVMNELALKPEHFYAQIHDVLYREILELQRIKGYYEVGLLIEHLTQKGLLDKVGGIDYIAQLTGSAATASNIRYYATQVLDKAQLRQLIQTNQKIIEMAQSASDVNEVLDEAEKDLLAITRDRRSGDFKTGGQVAKEVLQKVRDLSQGKIIDRGMKTNFKALDNVTRGFQPSDLIILAARPSVGKTAFALNIATEAAMIAKDKSVAIFSLEMPAEQLITRMLSSRSLIPSRALQTGKIQSNNLWNVLGNVVNEFSQAQIFIDDSSMTKMSDIFSKCRKLKNDHNLGMVVIDYIQLINSSGNSENRQQEVSLISRQLKQLARELDIPVIALSQLSRVTMQRKDQRPILSDIRESGSIEQDADMVMMLYREDYGKYDEEQKTEVDGQQIVEVIIAKHRNGATGTVKLAFTPEYNKFQDIIMDF